MARASPEKQNQLDLDILRRRFIIRNCSRAYVSHKLKIQESRQFGSESKSLKPVKSQCFHFKSEGRKKLQFKDRQAGRIVS